MPQREYRTLEEKVDFLWASHRIFVQPAVRRQQAMWSTLQEIKEIVTGMSANSETSPTKAVDPLPPGTGTTPKGRVTKETISEATVVMSKLPLKTWHAIKDRFDDDIFKANAELTVANQTKGTVVNFLFKTFLGPNRYDCHTTLCK